jgi:hypothetical protein
MNPSNVQLIEPHVASGGRGVQVGVLATVDPVRGVWVMLADRQRENPRQAYSTVQLSPSDEGRRVLMHFGEGDAVRPIVIGRILDEPVVPELPAEASLRENSLPEVRADGERICLEANEEIVLRCGKSSVVLRKSGEILIKGMKIVSRARGTHKVKGATVQIN